MSFIIIMGSAKAYSSVPYHLMLLFAYLDKLPPTVCIVMMHTDSQEVLALVYTDM